eukprot:9632368-Alexandrium_andersonii.AAC.1
MLQLVVTVHVRDKDFAAAGTRSASRPGPSFGPSPRSGRQGTARHAADEVFGHGRRGEVHELLPPTLGR